MVQSTRLYEQRRSTYQDLGVFLERARLRLYRFVPLLQAEFDAPRLPSGDEWADLQARAAVNGSGEVQARFAAYRDAEMSFYAVASTITAMPDANVAEDQIDAYRQQADETKMAAYAALDAVEEAMRDELASL